MIMMLESASNFKILKVVQFTCRISGIFGSLGHWRMQRGAKGAMAPQWLHQKRERARKKCSQ